MSTALKLGDHRIAYLLLTLTTLFWAGNAIIGRALHDSVHPVTLAFWRWALAALILLPFAWRHVMRDWRALIDAWAIMLVLSLFGIGCFNTMLYAAAQTTTATNIALIQTAMPATIVILGLLLFGDRVSKKGIFGVALSIAGAGVIVLRGSLETLATWHVVTGDVWMLVAVLCYALYSVLLRKRPVVHPLSFLVATFAIGALMLLPLYIWEQGRYGAPHLSGGLLAGTVYVAVFPSILAYLFWNRGVDLIGSNRAGLFICLVPVFASALAMVFLNEHLHAFHLVGLALIVVGFILFNHPGRAMDS
ncbi:MAG: EamA family transporter [Gammaproteobacteria bacterium]|jgi:drug/metabolite transporter (DMT)-like permease